MPEAAPCEAAITLPEPIREEAHRHLMRQRPLGLIDEKATRISDVGASCGGIFLRSGVEKISISKRRPFGPMQLRRHVSIRRVQDEAQRMLAERVIFHARLDVTFDKAHERPRSHYCSLKNSSVIAGPLTISCLTGL